MEQGLGRGSGVKWEPYFQPVFQLLWYSGGCYAPVVLGCECFTKASINEMFIFAGLISNGEYLGSKSNLVIIK